jgi:hypothetical protein
MANQNHCQAQPSEIAGWVAIGPQPHATELLEPTNGPLNVPAELGHFSLNATVISPYSMRLCVVCLAEVHQGVLTRKRSISRGALVVFPWPLPRSGRRLRALLPVAAMSAATKRPSPAPGSEPASDADATCNALFPSNATCDCSAPRDCSCVLSAPPDCAGRQSLVNLVRHNAFFNSGTAKYVASLCKRRQRSRALAPRAGGKVVPLKVKCRRP